MKKLLLALLMVASTSVFADSFIVERAHGDGINGNPNAEAWFVKGVIDINKNLATDAAITVTQTDGTNKVSSRADIGLIPKFDLYGSVRGYTRVAVGEKWSSSGNYSYYAIEPGITAPLGYGFSTKVGYRFRSAFDSGIADTTRTLRTSLFYSITPKDTIGIRLDNQRGDQAQDIWNINYARSF